MRLITEADFHQSNVITLPNARPNVLGIELNDIEDAMSFMERLEAAVALERHQRSLDGLDGPVPSEEPKRFIRGHLFSTINSRSETEDDDPITFHSEQNGVRQLLARAAELSDEELTLGFSLLPELGEEFGPDSNAHDQPRRPSAGIATGFLAFLTRPHGVRRYVESHPSRRQSDRTHPD